jgi:hypothetical protein
MAEAQPDSSSLIAELAREAQLGQLQFLDGLDAKAANLIGFAGIVLGLMFTSDFAREDWNCALTAGASLLAASTLPLGFALVPREYKVNPNIPALSKGYKDAAPDATTAIVIESIERALLWNADRIRRKAFAVGFGLVMLVLGVLVAGAGLLYPIV